MTPEEMLQVIGTSNIPFLKLINEARRSIKPNIPRDIAKYKRLGIPPHILIGLIMPIYYDARKASCCFIDQISLPNKEKLFNIAKNLWEDYGLLTGIIKIPCDNTGGLIYIFFFKDRDIYAKIGSINLMYEKGLINDFNDDVFINGIGLILEYPECCNKEFQRLRYSKIVLEEKIGDSLTTTKKINPASFFALEFYPCKINCKNSIIEGEKILKILKKQDVKLGEAFNICLEGNIEFVKEFKNKGNNLIMKKIDKATEEIFNEQKINFRLFNKNINIKL